MDLQELVGACLRPFDGPDGPGGMNARREPLYDQARTQISKLTAQTIGEEAIDWKGLVEACTELLTTKTKDLALGAYLSLGLMRTQGYEGLAAGLEVLSGLVKGLWEEAWPPAKRARARANIFEWTDQRLAEAVEAITPETRELEALTRARALASELAELIQQKMGLSQVTGLSTLRGALKRWLEELAPPEPEPQPAEDQQPSPDEPQGPGLPGQLEDMDQGLELLGQIVELVRALEPASPIPYRLARVMRWDVVEELPRADASGRTQLSAPRAEELEALQALEKAGQWAELVEAAESRFLAPGGLFILGLQRMVCQGLKATGAQGAAEAVEWETRRLVERLPGIATLKFDDGSPFADGPTRAWLQTLKGSEEQSSGSTPPQPPAFAQLMAQGKLAEALAEADKAVAGAAGGRQQALIRLEVAQGCLAEGKWEWARAILEGLEEEMARCEIDRWDPEICARVVAGLIQALQALGGGRQAEGAEQERLAGLRKRLFRLEMARAAGVEDGGT